VSQIASDAAKRIPEDGRRLLEPHSVRSRAFSRLFANPIRTSTPLVIIAGGGSFRWQGFRVSDHLGWNAVVVINGFRHLSTWLSGCGGPGKHVDRVLCVIVIPHAGQRELDS